MHNDFSLLATITMAVLFAFLCGFAARKLRLPSLVGYLIAGLLISPFTPGFVGDVSAAGQLAEVGVIFMMFGVGLHFSLRDLWNVRQIAIPGAILQTTLSTLIGLALGQLWGWSFEAGLVLGLSISVASTVVLLRGLTDHGLVSTPHGRVAIGWLVFEDLATIVILVLMPVLVGGSGNPLVSVGVALLKTAVFVIIMLVIGTRVLSWLLTQIAYTRSRELFILAVVAMAVGTSFAAFELFGVSLALGAFLAGVVIGESDVHHQVNAEAVPFRDFFSVLFFVSVGMLVDPAVVMANIGKVVVLSLLVIGGKAVITLLLGFVLPSSARTMIVVAAGLSQIGEFSFIVGQAGVGLGLIDGDQYGLILAAAVVSIVVNPLMFALIPGMERALRGVPWLWRLMDRGGPTPVAFTEEMEGHVVIIGYGRVGSHIGSVLQQLGLPFLVVEQNMAHANEIQARGIKTLFGDAANSEILLHTGLEHARALVVTAPNETTTELIVAAAHAIAPTLPIIARAATADRLPHLYHLGAHHAINPEMEGGLEMLRYTLLSLGHGSNRIQPYLDAVRTETYEGILPEEGGYPVLDQLLTATRGVEIAWELLNASSPVIGHTLAEAGIRSRVGASVVAVLRGGEVITNPDTSFVFQEDDLVGMIGSSGQLAEACFLLNSPVG
ncbi:MAG: cation:proton antiporter [Candidatus Promineofilum sp.]|nr:cation:proton antiporter [Promineifilum sp.]MCW5863355.1 cation:proton antiporter [Anaerolineae bacterium]